MKYYAEKGETALAKKYWNRAKMLHALLNPADSHLTISLVAQNNYADALEMYDTLNKNHVTPLPETFDVVAKSLQQEGMEKQARVVEQHKFRSYR